MIDEVLLFVMPVVFAGVSVPCEYSRHNRPLVFATRRRWDMAVACAEGAASVDDAVCVVAEQLCGARISLSHPANARSCLRIHSSAWNAPNAGRDAEI